MVGRGEGEGAPGKGWPTEVSVPPRFPLPPAFPIPLPPAFPLPLPFSLSSKLNKGPVLGRGALGSASGVL